MLLANAPDLSVDSIPMLRQQLIRYLRSNDDRKTETWKKLRRKMLLERYQFLQACEQDEVAQEYARRLSKSNFWFFLRTFGIVYEDRHTAPYGSGVLPFVPMLHQELVAQFFFDTSDNGDVGLCMKTRDMGVSWVVYHMIVWCWLFDENFSCLLGSHAEAEVDLSAGKMNTQTMFGRIEMIVHHLPTWLVPGLNMDDTDQRQKLYWRNPNNGNLLQGKASTGKFGRQGRFTWGFMDEFDHWEDPLGALIAIRDSCGAVFCITTPTRKTEGISKRMIEEEKCRLLEMPWMWHPYKDSAWYEKQKKERFEEAVATELDLEMDAGKSLLIYPEYARIPKGDYPFRPDWWTYGGIDFGRTDGCGLVWVQRSPRSLLFRIVGSYYRAGQTFEHFLPFMGGPMLAAHADYSQRDLEFIDKTRFWERSPHGVEWFGDPAGRQRTVTSNRNVLERLAEHHVYVSTNPRILSHQDRQSATHNLLRSTEGVHIDDCGMLDRSMKRYRRAERSQNSTATENIKPVHKWSDVPSALEYLAVNLPDPDRYTPGEPTSRRRAAWER